METKRQSFMARVAMTLLLTVLTTVTAWADTWPEYITDVILVGGTESEVNAAKAAHSDYTFISQDLNKGCGSSSDYIYLGYKKGYRANVNGGYITDIIVIDAEGTNPPSTVTYSGRTYYLCPYDGGSHFEDVKGNLNSNCGGGWNLYLYYTKANIGKQAVSSITVNSTKDGAINCYYTNGNSHETQIDLNRGLSGSSDVYMHLTTATKTNRPSADPVMASGLVYNNDYKQLIKTAATISSGTMYYNLGLSGSWTTDPTSLTALSAGTYTIYYYAGSNSYGNASSTHSQTVTIAKSPNSITACMSPDVIESEGPRPTVTGDNLSTGAITYQYSTSQNGTYSTTAPTTAGTYWVKATIAADDNCYEYTTPAVSFKMLPDWALHNTGDSEADAYVITTTGDLDLLAQRVNAGNAYSGKYFRLGANITYSHDSEWNNTTSTENNYTPIGKSGKTFKGHFDGKGFTVSGIRISSSNNYKGLFGYLYDGATVKNVILSDARIMYGNYSGGIAGTCNKSTITNCWVKSNVCIGRYSYVGGIAGTLYGGAIIGCRSEATLIAASGDSRERYGGIAGTLDSSPNVKHCIVAGATVPGTAYCGAVVGKLWTGSLTNNYYINCTVAGVADATNVGCNKDDNLADTNGARKAVTIGAATGVTITPVGTETNYNLSGITAYEGNNGIIYGGQLYAGAGETVRLNIAYTVPEYFALNGFTDGNGNALTDNGDGTYTLTMTDETATVTPDGVSLWGTASGADGSQANPYVITTPAGLDLLASNVNGGNKYYGSYFVLGNDIVYDADALTLDLDGDGNNDSNYMPVGNSASSFSGNFDGQGHTISGISVNANGMNRIGVFGINGGTVKNLTVSGCLFAGNSKVGAIAGLNRGTVENCHVAADVSVTGNNGVGGVVGNNEDFVLGCTSAATLSANKETACNFGGVAGYNSVTLTDNLFTGTIDKMPNNSRRIGAITGYNDTDYSGTLTNNFHTCSGMGGVGNDNDATNTDQAGAQFAYEFPTANGAMGNTGSTYGTGDYTGITAYQHGLYYNGNYYISLWGGSGTEADPYVIYNTAGMDKLATDVNGGNYYINTYFVLGNDIAYDAGVLTLDLDGDGNNDSNYMPVGKDVSPFMGNFDGQGHTISGISVNANGVYLIGVFGINDGTVKNLTVSDCLFAGDGYVGAIAGLNRGTVENCHVATYVSVTGNYKVGGVVGDNDRGFVLGCTSAATLSAKEYARYFGGVAGYNSVTLTDNLFTGTIDKMPDGSWGIGAITGYNDTERGTLTNNFHTCSGMGGVGNDADATNTDQAGAQTAVARSTQPDASIIGEEKKTYGGTQYTGITAYENGLYYNGNYYYFSLWGGSGTEADPYVIYNTAGMDKLANDVNGGKYYQDTYFVLGNDIAYVADALTLDLDGDGNNDSNYMPVGNNASPFCGNFDGQGHSISGILVNANGMYRIGVFGINDGTVKNLTVSDCLFAGSMDVGAIAGMNRGTVENCHVAADVSVTGNNIVGGVVGENEGFVLGCTSAAALSINNEYAGYFGGIAGSNVGTLTDNLFTGTIGEMPDDSWGIGAITGNNDTDYGTLTNNFHTCSGMGGVGNSNDATNTDQAGAQFAMARSTQPDASIIGEEKKTYGGTEYTGITAYENGLYYNGNYYYRHEDVFMTIDLTGDATASAPITLWGLIERTMYGVYVDYDNYTIDLNLDGEGDLQLVPDMDNGVIRISKLTGAANLTTNSLFELIEDGSCPYNGLVIKIDNSYQTEKVRPIFGIYDSGKDGMDFYNSSNIRDNDGKQFDVMLKDRTFKKDGKWQTIVLPFDVDLTDPNSPLYGITYRTVTAANIENGTTLNLTFAENSNGDENTLLAGKPYIIKWDKAADYQGNESQYDITDPVFPNVTIQYVGNDFWNDTYNFTVAFLGTYNGWTNLASYFADVSESGLNKPMDVVLLGGDNKLHYAASDASLGACRAIFLVDPAAVTTADPAAHLTNYVMNLGNGEKLMGTFGDVMPGDANGDGVVTISDAVAIVNYILGKAPAGFNEAAADMNGDGKVTITDAVRVVNMIAAQQ